MKTNKLFILVLILLSLFLVSCGDSVSKYQKMLDKSLDKVKTVETKTSITDEDVTVYEQIKNVTVEDTKATVVTNVSTLNSSFVLETKETTDEVDNIERSLLCSFELNEEYFLDFRFEENLLYCTISKDNFSKVFKSSDTDFKIYDVARLTITVDDNKISNITCTFSLASLKLVTISTVYGY